jgi:hypothetical protein
MQEEAGMHKVMVRFAVLAIFILPVFGVAQEAAEETAPATDSTSGVMTVEAEVCTGIQDRMPVGSATEFPADVDTVYLWTKVTGAEDTTMVVDVWSHEGEEMARVELPVKSPSWRTWSSKAIRPDWTGKWDVKVLDAEGNVLKGVEFTIVPSAQTPTELKHAEDDTTNVKKTTEEQQSTDEQQK